MAPTIKTTILPAGPTKRVWLRKMGVWLTKLPDKPPVATN